MIHGIGDIAVGHVLDSAVSALDRHFAMKAVPGSRVVAEPDQPGHASVRSAVLEWQSRRIDLIEFNWTGVVGKMRLTQPIDAVCKFLGVLRDVPALGCIDSERSWERTLLSICGWLFQSIFVVLLVTSLVALGHELTRHEIYNAALAESGQPSIMSLPDETEGLAMDSGKTYSDAISRTFSGQKTIYPVAIQFIVMGCLAGFSIAAYLMLSCAIVVLPRRPRQATLMLLAAALGGLLLLLSAIGLMLAGIFVFQLGLGLLQPQVAPWEKLVIGSLVALIVLWLPVRVIVAIGNLIRDVVHYLAPERGGASTRDQQAVRSELRDLIDEVQANDHYRHVVLVAHSLGTVILTDLLRERASTIPAIEPAMLHVVTAGSPLRRLRRFFPRRIPHLLVTRRQLADAPGVRLARWFNAYRIADYVGQGLTRSAFCLDLLGIRRRSGDAARGIEDHLLVPRYRWPFAHADYWADARFLRFIAQDVLQPLLK